jgi:hypothetical protein
LASEEHLHAGELGIAAIWAGQCHYAEYMYPGREILVAGDYFELPSHDNVVTRRFLFSFPQCSISALACSG